MAFTTVPTVNTSDLWTAGNHNTYIKDNFDFIAQNQTIPLPLIEGKTIESISAGGNPTTLQSTGASPKVTCDALYLDDSVDEGLEWRSLICPPVYGANPVLTVYYHMDGTNSSDQVTLCVRIAAVSDGDTSVEAKVYDTVNVEVINVPDSADEHDVIDISLSNIDGLVAGDRFNIAIYRDGDASEAGAEDDATGDMIITGLELQFTYV